MKIKYFNRFHILDFIHPTRCDICGHYPVIPYMDNFGHKACFSHRHEGKLCHCSFCGRFCLQEKTINISEGVRLCATCMNDVPKVSQELGQIAFSIRKYYRECGLGELPKFWVYQVKYDQLLKKDGKVILAYAEKQSNYYNIYLYEGLSRIIYTSTLAHEVLHLWQWEHNIVLPADLREGFCNLGSYMVMKNIKTEDAIMRIKMYERDTDPIYGDGFRKMKNIYDNGGWPAVIDFLHQTHSV